MTEHEFCPGCGRHCSLNHPHCEKGTQYLYARKDQETEPEASRQERHTVCGPNADINDQLIIRLRDISHMMHRQYEGKASQKRILIILHASGVLTQRALTERLGIQPGSASEILSKLEHAGLITRTPNQTDRRTTDIQLTDAGTALALEAVEQRQKRHKEMFSCLSSEEKETLLSLLETIHSDWENRFPGSSGRRSHGEHPGCRHGHGAKHPGRHPHF